MLIKLTPSTEDYLSAIYRLYQQDGVRSVDVARVLDVSKPSVNRAVKTLCELKLVTQKPYGNIYLTPLGKEKAVELNKKYAILKGFFVQVLKMDEAAARSEAHQLEHGMSTDTINRIGKLIRKYSDSRNLKDN